MRHPSMRRRGRSPNGNGLTDVVNNQVILTLVLPARLRLYLSNHPQMSPSQSTVAVHAVGIYGLRGLYKYITKPRTIVV